MVILKQSRLPRSAAVFDVDDISVFINVPGEVVFVGVEEEDGDSTRTLVD